MFVYVNLHIFRVETARQGKAASNPRIYFNFNPAWMLYCLLNIYFFLHFRTILTVIIRAELEFMGHHGPRHVSGG
jgi:hypothetical protein